MARAAHPAQLGLADGSAADTRKFIRRGGPLRYCRNIQLNHDHERTNKSHQQ